MNEEARMRVEEAKDRLARDIDQDPSSQKVEYDPKVIGLFGFESSYSPVDNLRASIDSKIDVTTRPKKEKSSNGVAYKYRIKYPQKNQIYGDNNLNVPWVSKSWVELLERGISNVEKFFFSPSQGRSEFGVQGKGDSLKPVSDPTDPDYLDRIRGGFAENLRK